MFQWVASLKSLDLSDNGVTGNNGLTGNNSKLHSLEKIEDFISI